MSRTWKHDELLADLAEHLRGSDRMVWTDMQLGPSGSPRPDAFVLQRSYSKPNPTAFEVKVSRSDFRSDTTKGKWQSYLLYAGSVTFAVPDGLVTVADVPTGCGLIVRKAEVWRYVRKPTVQRVTPPFDACMKLLIDGVGRVSRSPAPRPRQISTWEEHEAVRKKFGAAVALAARNLVAAEKRVLDIKIVADGLYDQARKDVEMRKGYLLEQAKREAAEYQAMKRELCSLLDLEPEVSFYEIRRKMTAAIEACNADTRVVAVEQKLSFALSSVRHALQALEPRVGAA